MGNDTMPWACNLHVGRVKSQFFPGLAHVLLWVKNGSVGASCSFPLYPTKQTSTVATETSVSCQYRKLITRTNVLTELPPLDGGA